LAIITRARFEEQHLAIQRRILRGLLCELLGGAQRSFPRIEALVDAVASGHAGRRHLQSDLWYQVTADQLILRRGAPRNLAIEVALPGRTEIGELGLALEVGLASNTDLEAIKAGLSAERAAFDADRVGRRLQLRSARPGDRFQPLGMSGRKRVSEFLIDAGTPRILRDDVLLLTRGPEIVWVTGMRPAHPFRVQSGTRRVMIAQLLGRPDPEV
jgi:tRNA(Ile)-lysidine synthase